MHLLVKIHKYGLWVKQPITCPDSHLFLLFRTGVMFSALIFCHFGLNCLQKIKTLNIQRDPCDDCQVLVFFVFLFVHWLVQHYGLLRNMGFIKFHFKVCCIKKKREGKGHSEAAPSGCDIHSFCILKIKNIYYRFRPNLFLSGLRSVRAIAFVSYDQVHWRSLLFCISVQHFNSCYSLHHSLSVLLCPFHFTARPFFDPDLSW